MPRFRRPSQVRYALQTSILIGGRDARMSSDTTQTSTQENYETMGKLALVTGASSGIGKAFARTHAESGGDLIITARGTAALERFKEELENAFGVEVHVITSDLSKMDGAQKLFDEIQKRSLQVDYLINNAGVGGNGDLLDRDLQEDVDMIVLNIISYVTLTHLIGKQMAERGGGRIMNVGSFAGFIPGPNRAVYHATKAFVNSFSQAVDQELEKKGISCTVLCPGFVDTDMVERGGAEGRGLASPDGPTRVARLGYDAMLKKKLLVINEYKLRFLSNWVIPFIPRRLLLAVVEYNHRH